MAASEGVEFVALPCVESKDKIDDCRVILDSNGSEPGIIAKIGCASGLKALDEIVESADAVLIDRSELGQELSPEKIPLVQNIITTKVNLAGKVVITASDLLLSMMDNPRPTRAEMTDVANAVFQSTDAVMLDAETAVGSFPPDCISTICDIASTAEQATNYYSTQ